MNADRRARTKRLLVQSNNNDNNNINDRWGADQRVEKYKTKRNNSNANNIESDPVSGGECGSTINCQKCLCLARPETTSTFVFCPRMVGVLDAALHRRRHPMKSGSNLLFIRTDRGGQNEVMIA